MKQLCSTYTFTTGSSNTGSVTLTGLNIPQSQLLLITYQYASSSVILYNFAARNNGAYSVTPGTNTNVVFNADTTGYASTGSLTIFYDDGVIDGTTLSSIYTNGLKLSDGTNTASISTAVATGSSATANRVRVSALNMLYNGVTVDPQMGGVIGETGSAVGYANVIPATGTVAGAFTVASNAYASSLIAKATPGTAMMISGYSSNTATQFIQVFNTASVPANGAAPLMVISVFAQQNFAFSIPTTGMPFTNGIVICNSSTGPTKTIGSADCYFTAVIK